MILEFSIIVIVISFLLGYIDSTLGMGYGTALAPILLLLGFNPLQVVPAILLSQLIIGLFIALLHNKVGNVNFGAGKGHFRIASVLTACSIAGVFAAVFIAISLPTIILKAYIGILVLVIGLVMLFGKNKQYAFSWKNIIGLGILSAFNKGISGGGYGPVVVNGQILSGVDGKNAIGITTLAKGLTCLAGVIAYLLIKSMVDWSLVPYLLIGALVSLPFSALTVKKIKVKKLKLAVGIFTVILGVVTLINILL